MNVLFTRAAWADYLGWLGTDREVTDRIHRMINDIQRSPFAGLGKPEPLRRNLTGWWSRRITAEHRLVYRIAGTGETQRIEIMSCRFHYTRRS